MNCNDSSSFKYLFPNFKRKKIGVLGLSQIKIPVCRRNPIFEIENFIVSSQIFPKRQPDVVKPKLAFTLSPPTPVWRAIRIYDPRWLYLKSRSFFNHTKLYIILKQRKFDGFHLRLCASPSLHTSLNLASEQHCCS